MSRSLALTPERKNQLKIIKIGDPISVGIAISIQVPSRKHKGEISEVDHPIFVEVGWTFGRSAYAREAGAWLPVLSARKLALPIAQKDAIKADATGAQLRAVVAAVHGVVAKIVAAHTVAFVGRDIQQTFFTAEAAGAEARNTLFNIIEKLTGIKPENASVPFAVAF